MEKQAFAGTTVVITCGASDIGRASAEAFVAACAHVVLLDYSSPPSAPR